MARRIDRKTRKTLAACRAHGERLDSRVLLAGVAAVVTTTLDLAGIGVTLRDAIRAVDSSTGTPNSISFNIPTTDPGYNPVTGAFTIKPLTVLPAITKPVLIDGTTESSFLGKPALVVIDGSQIKGPADGLSLGPSAPGSAIEGLEITTFDGSGIVIQAARNTVGGITPNSGNVLLSNTTAGVSIAPQGGDPAVISRNLIIGNLIGTDAIGNRRSNGVGILIHSSNNTVGGTSTAAGNIIGSNTTAGVAITGTQATGNDVLGNFIGTNASGANLANALGVLDSAGKNTIGGNSTAAANVFGFNSAAGLELTGKGDLVIGNFFGTNPGGSNLANTIGALDSIGSNTIGGTSTAAANVFGFNSSAGLQIAGAHDVVIGNLFGTNTSGANLAGNVGLSIGGASNTIGGTTAGAGNVFAFNSSAGAVIAGTGATGNLLLGNWFGTDASGASLGNVNGLVIGSAANTIGGTTPGAANFIGFNTTAGVVTTGTSASGNVLLGNLIGLSAAGTDQHNDIGIILGSADNTIGGTTQNAANVISFNTSAGVQITGAGASGNVLLGNKIGTDSTGQFALGNDVGVFISDGTGNIIGAAGAANVISGNVTAGIELSGNSVSGTQIVGNEIGTDATGTNAVIRANQPPLQARQNAGIVIIGSVGNTIGGTSASASNVISGNYVGVMLATITAQGAAPNQVVGNLIGTDSSGHNALDNVVGIYINGAAGNQIGLSGAPNIISGNSSVGVEIYGAGSTANLVQGNIIGLASDGTGALRKPNGQFAQPTGVFILNASRNTIGGSATSDRNVISGNQNAGVYIFSQAGVSSGNIIEQNLVGRAASGTAGPGNNGYGVLFLNAPNNQPGSAGPASNRFGRNRIANFRSLTGLAVPAQSTAAQGRALNAARHHHFQTRKRAH